MALSRLLFAIFIIGTALGQELAESESNNRQPRSLHKKRLCKKYGICEGYGGYQGGYQGYQGQPGYPGYPINIAISQSQSSTNGADGGFNQGYHPNNYQYNGPHGYGGYNQGYGGYNHGYGGYSQYGGYQGHRPGYYGNGQGSYNNQFNGNYYGGPNGGYGFQRPFGHYYDEDESHEDDSEEGYGFGRSIAVAQSKSSA